MVLVKCLSLFYNEQIDEESNKIVKAEMFFDGGELLGGLVKGGSFDELATSGTSCPFMHASE